VVATMQYESQESSFQVDPREDLNNLQVSSKADPLADGI
jgi:hypothetical protein